MTKTLSEQMKEYLKDIEKINNLFGDITWGEAQDIYTEFCMKHEPIKMSNSLVDFLKFIHNYTKTIKKM